jgi:hypothetical protein
VQAIALMFPPTERKRIITAASVDEADYFVTTYRDYQFTGDYPFEHEFYAIKIGGAKIVVVYDLHSATEKEKSERNMSLPVILVSSKTIGKRDAFALRDCPEDDIFLDSPAIRLKHDTQEKHFGRLTANERE